MKILAMLYMLTANGPVPVAAYFTQDAHVICRATAAAQNATEEEEYYCEYTTAFVHDGGFFRSVSALLLYPLGT